jgi:hypothetical protein
VRYELAGRLSLQGRVLAQDISHDLDEIFSQLAWMVVIVCWMLHSSPFSATELYQCFWIRDAKGIIVNLYITVMQQI